MLGCCRRNSPSSVRADRVWPCSSLAPWVCLGVKRTGELVKGQVKDELLFPEGIGLGLLMGSLRFSLLAVRTVP